MWQVSHLHFYKKVKQIRTDEHEEIKNITIPGRQTRES